MYLGEAKFVYKTVSRVQENVLINVQAVFLKDDPCATRDAFRDISSLILQGCKNKFSCGSIASYVSRGYGEVGLCRRRVELRAGDDERGASRPLVQSTRQGLPVLRSADNIPLQPSYSNSATLDVGHVRNVETAETGDIM